MHRRNWGSLAMVLVALPAFAQQTGAIVGKVTAKSGKALAGVRIEAVSNVLPQPRKVVTAENGEFRLPFLPPGTYTLTFLQTGMMPAKRSAEVLLQQNTPVNVAMAEAQVASAEVEVVAQATLVDRSSSELKTAVTSEVMNSLPVGHDYRDLVKLIPGVQYTQDAVRGPSAGGSGQDNVYQFDGVNVNLPLFGTMSAEPATHDIDQIAIVKGGAAATDFNRSAGFSINSISKSGTNAFKGGLSYQILPQNLVAKRTTISSSVYEQNLTYLMANVGGPIVKENLFFFVSYYRPAVTRENQSNLYGPVPEYSSTRDELFGKLTFSPTSTFLLNVSYRTSDRKYSHSPVGGATAASVSSGGKSTLDIGIIEGTLAVTPSSFLNFKFTSFDNKTQDAPDSRFGIKPALDGSVRLDVNALDTMGAFSVPVLHATDTAYNAFITPIINKYGYLNSAGVRTGGGLVGGASQINNQDFFRRSIQLAYDASFGNEVTHEFHAGFQQYKDWEDLYRVSNGWGSVTVPRALTFNGQAVAFAAAVQQQGILNVPTLHSEYVSKNIEINDKIRWQDFTFNVGLLMSNDELYGQGLKRNPYTISGWEQAAGAKYLMHEIEFKDALQPRLGITWAYNGPNTVYANWARYVPAASSLPRAASWARNKAVTINAYFTATGTLIGSQAEASSTGKLFADGMQPRKTDELLVGTTRDFGKGWTTRFHARYRRSFNFWEDTNNNARVSFNPPDGIPREYYIPDLGAKMAQLGGGSNNSYVIAQLAGAFTKYYETGVEAEWRSSKAYFRGSYVWSHYFGNFDQDNSTTTGANDSNIFIGSSNIADDGGRQIWDNKYGNLAGDRRHQLKVYGYYQFPWNGRVGAYAIYQSGQPWQAQSYEPYLAIIGTSRSDTNRYSEPAGAHRTGSHHQLDLNYTQAFIIKKRVSLELILDVYNVFNKQTGYNVQSSVHSALFGQTQSFFSPRRAQFGVRMQF